MLIGEGSSDYMDELAVILEYPMDTSQRDELGAVFGVGDEDVGTGYFGGYGYGSEGGVLREEDGAFFFVEEGEEVGVVFYVEKEGVVFDFILKERFHYSLGGGGCSLGRGDWEEVKLN